MRFSGMLIVDSWRSKILFTLVCLLMIASSRCQSGNQGSVSGTVLDQSGTAVAGAHLLIRSLSTSWISSTFTDNKGFFRFAILPVGSYELTANSSGFATTEVIDIDLTVGENLTFTLCLKVAGAKEVLTVSGAPAVLDRGRTQVSTTIDSSLVPNLPVDGRDFTSFALLASGVTRDARGGLSYAGQRGMNSLLLDGISNDDPFWGQPAGGTGFVADGRQPYYVSEDAVREFQVNSNAYSAELGRAGGGVINAITKSGSNEFHGSGFWFYRDRAMNANNPINKLHRLAKSPFHYHQFGGTLGGPIRQDRLFFFLNYEGLKSNLPNAVFLNLPSGFHTSADSVVAFFQQAALDYLKARAAPYQWPINQNDYLAKADWQISENNRFTALWDRQRYAGGGSTDADPQEAFEHSESQLSRVDTGMASITSALSSRTINVARFGFLENSEGSAPVGINPEANIFEGGQRILTIGRNRNSPQESPASQLQFSDTFHDNVGSHDFKLGSDVLIDHVRFFIAQNFSGSYDFGSLESLGRSLSGQSRVPSNDDYTQTFSSSSQHGITTHPDFISVAGFAEDMWRIRPNLTFNLGIRYDLQLAAQPPVRNPSSVLLSAGLDTSTLPIDKRNLAPRIGMTWSPAAFTDRLLLRAGYGIFYAATPAALTARAFFQNGVTAQTRTFFGNSPLALLIPEYPNTFCGPPDPSGISPNCAPPNVGSAPPTLQLFSPHYKQPYVEQGSLGIEFQVARDTGVTATYIFSKGSQLQQIRDANLGSSVTASISIAGTQAPMNYREFLRPRPIKGYNRILVFNSDASSMYHGAAIEVNHRLSHDLETLASYTFSKVIDNNPNVYALNPGPVNGDLVQDPTSPSSDRGPGTDDQRHRLTFCMLWRPNYENSVTGIFKPILQEWELSGIVTAQSGQPYSGHIGFDLNNDGDFGSDRTPGTGRNSFYAPATFSVDPRITRDINITEKAKLQIIVESFNLLNHANFTSVNNLQYSVSGFSSECGIASSPCLVPNNGGPNAFGTPMSSSGARIVQVASKITF